MLTCTNIIETSRYINSSFVDQIIHGGKLEVKENRKITTGTTRCIEEETRPHPLHPRNLHKSIEK